MPASWYRSAIDLLPGEFGVPCLQGSPPCYSTSPLRSGLGGEKTHSALCGLTILCSGLSLSFQSDGLRMDQVRGSWRRKMEFSFISAGVCGPCRLLCPMRSWLWCRGMTPRHALPPHPQCGSPSIMAQSHSHIHA